MEDWVDTFAAKPSQATTIGSSHVWGVTDVGRVRSHNEDAFAATPEGNVLIVADGMGGHAAGEVASALVVETMLERLRHQGRLARTAAMERMQVAIAEGHAAVLSAIAADPDRAGMGATVVAAVVGVDFGVIGHVGDARVYLWRSGALQQLTEDHSFVQMLVRSGELDVTEVRVHPRRNEILQAMGLPTGIMPTWTEVELQVGDQLLLCSDGLWEELTEEVMAQFLASPEGVRCRCEALVAAANEAGGRDNVTALLYQHGGMSAEK